MFIPLILPPGTGVHFALLATLVTGGSAAALPRGLGYAEPEECCFQLQANGGTQGTVGELWTGENRVEGNFEQETYCIRDDRIYDKQGRGCNFVGPSAQWQCTEDAEGTFYIF